VIISAYATTGERWTDAQNERADRALHDELRARGTWTERITGFSPKTDHAEPSWATELSLAAGLDFGRRFRQDAIYHVLDDELSVTRCDPPGDVVPVGAFRIRVDVERGPDLGESSRT
jgi:hypothetical protein